MSCVNLRCVDPESLVRCSLLRCVFVVDGNKQMIQPWYHGGVCGVSVVPRECLCGARRVMSVWCHSTVVVWLPSRTKPNAPSAYYTYITFRRTCVQPLQRTEDPWNSAGIHTRNGVVGGPFQAKSISLPLLSFLPRFPSMANMPI